MRIWAVVLAGGIGSRFWPLSTPERPKQLLPLISNEPLLRDTLSRLRALAPGDRTLVLTHESLADTVRSLAEPVPPHNVLAEPVPAGTAAALAWAASEIKRRGGGGDVMVSVHADWAIADPDAFVAALRDAARVADETSALVTVGIVPTRDDPSFGYLLPGSKDPSGANRVLRFVEKPTRERAVELRSRGALWNSGIFAWGVDAFLDELRRHTPEVSAALAISESAEFFAAVQPVSIDVGLLERSSEVLVLAGNFGWDDIGTWSALRRIRPADGEGNVAHGSVHAVEARGNLVHSDGPRVVLYGVNDLVVISAGDITLVTTIERATDLKTLLNALPPEVRDRT